MSVVEMPSNKPAKLQRRGTTASPLIVPARNGHRRVLRDLFVQESTGGGRIDIAIGNVTKMRLRTNLAQAIMTQALSGRNRRLGFLGYIATLIPNFPFPNAAEDEDITLTYTAVGASALTRIDAYYEDVTEGDVKSKSLPGGSLNDTDFVVLNLYNTAAVTATQSYDFDKLDEPVGVSPFTESPNIQTGARRISPGQKFTVFAIAADVPSPGAGDKTTRVHIFDEKIELFTSENNEGLLVDPEVVNELGFDLDPLEGFVLDEPYVLSPNRLYSFSGDYTKAAVNAAAESQKLFLIGLREPAGGA